MTALRQEARTASAMCPRPEGGTRLLMCPPTAYGLRYEINPWMSLRHPPDTALADDQWQRLCQVLTGECGARVELVEQAADAPDMVFTANAGLVCGRSVLLSRFRHPQRQVEEGPFHRWFEARGYEVAVPPVGMHFEGEGDALFADDLVVAAYWLRTDIEAHRWVSDQLGMPVLSVELVDRRWYHLDTAFFPLAPGVAVWYPGAFDRYARAALAAHFELLEVPAAEALRFACNSVVLGHRVVMPAGCPRTRELAEERGFTVHSVELSEYIKCGGAAKCLVLVLA